MSNLRVTRRALRLGVALIVTTYTFLSSLASNVEELAPKPAKKHQDRPRVGDFKKIDSTVKNPTDILERTRRDYIVSGKLIMWEGDQNGKKQRAAHLRLCRPRRGLTSRLPRGRHGRKSCQDQGEDGEPPKLFEYTPLFGNESIPYLPCRLLSFHVAVDARRRFEEGYYFMMYEDVVERVNETTKKGIEENVRQAVQADRQRVLENMKGKIGRNGVLVSAFQISPRVGTNAYQLDFQDYVWPHTGSKPFYIEHFSWPFPYPLYSGGKAQDLTNLKLHSFLPRRFKKFRFLFRKRNELSRYSTDECMLAIVPTGTLADGFCTIYVRAHGDKDSEGRFKYTLDELTEKDLKEFSKHIKTWRS